MRYYKDRDFPEVKLSNADIVAVIENPKQLQRIILEQNDLIDRLVLKDEEIERLRTQIQTLSVSDRPPWASEEDMSKAMKEIFLEMDVLKIAKEMRCDRVVDGKRVCYEDCKWDNLCEALNELDSVK